MSRIDRVNERIKREVGDILLKELKDPRLQFVTITHAEVSKDLQHAKVYFSVLGSQVKAEKAQEGLNAAKGMIRSLLGERIQMRYTPDIVFFYDDSIEYGARIEAKIEEIHNEFKKD